MIVCGHLLVNADSTDLPFKLVPPRWLEVERTFMLRSDSGQGLARILQHLSFDWSITCVFVHYLTSDETVPFGHVWG